MKEKDIYHRLSEPLTVNEYNGRTISSLEFENNNYKAKYTAFYNVNFDNLVRFENTDLSLGIFFENCHFFGPLICNNVSASGYDFLVSPDSQSIVFKNCIFHETVEFYGVDGVIERTVLFEGSKFKKRLRVEYLNISMEGLTIRNCVVNDECDLFNITLKQDLTFIDNTINSIVRLGINSISTLKIVGNNIFNDTISIHGGLFNNGIIFSDGVFKKEVTVSQAVSEKDGLKIFGSNFDKAVFVNFRSDNLKPIKGLNSFYFSDTNFNNGIYINGTENILSQNPIVEKIEISISSELKGDITFRGLHVGWVGFSGYNSSANIFLDNIYINQLVINALINNAGLIFTNVKASYIDWYSNEATKQPRLNAIYISDSNFGKAQFYQVDFSSFDNISLHNNILTDISTSMVRWFTPSQLDKIEDSGSWQIYQNAKKMKDKSRVESSRKSILALFRSKQEIYRQLKLASQRQADLPQALEFQKHEMNFYRKSISLTKPRKWSETIILWSNQSNDFGQNWLKALAFLVLFSFASYLPIGFLTSDKLDYTKCITSFSHLDVNLEVIFFDNIKYWIVLLNPVHRISDLNENIEKYSNWIYVWDLLSRIIVSYFIFQMISAFRKFNK